MSVFLRRTLYRDFSDLYQKTQMRHNVRDFATLISRTQRHRIEKIEKKKKK